MTGQTLRIATWNILGRRVAGTHDVADAGAICSVVTEHRPDILCLQEVHFYGGRPDSQLVAELRSAGLSYFVGFPLSDSHLDRSALLGLGIASAWPLVDKYEFKLTNPGLRASVRGEDWTLHDKGVVGCEVKLLNGRTVQIHCLHLFPFHEFWAVSDERYVNKMWYEFWQYADSMAAGRDKVIFAGDFNQGERKLAAQKWSSRRWHFCLDDLSTTSMGLSLDDIVLSSEPQSIAVGLIPTFSDHHFATVKVELGLRKQAAQPTSYSRYR
jgi:endonuclease/exonuclease/phosphatase family metal-dependent hydrolase